MGSHSALDVCRGAKDEGFNTLVIAQKGREKTYTEYYKNIVDEVILVDKFKDILSAKVQKVLLKKNCIFIPHRSFEVYLWNKEGSPHINDYSAIEKKFKVPIFGNRYLLKVEERGVNPNQYDLLDKAKIRYPKQFKNPKDIDRLCIVKVLEKERGFERAFFLVSSGNEIKKSLKNVVIEEFIAGVQVNFNFFYDPIDNKLELIGTDTRRQTNIDGFSKLDPANAEMVWKRTGVKWEEAGHMAVTVLESMLEDAFAMGERFVKASKDLYKPGVIGPFGLQTMIIPGPPKKEIIVFDVSPRMPGSPGISATPYSGYLYGQNISMGRRVAMEIKKAIELDKLKEVLT